MTAEPPLLTIGRLARTAGLARGTLLHYEALGLLVARARSAAGYRLYGRDEVQRLQRIRSLRAAGLSLAEVGTLMVVAEGGAAALLAQRLQALGDEVEQRRTQQRRLAQLLALDELRAGPLPGGKTAWVSLLRRAGFSDEEMRQWHAHFEAEDAAAHRAFLRALGLSAAEIAAVRRFSRSPGRR